MLIVLRTALIFALCCLSLPARAADRPPNVVIVYIDDMGYADPGPFGATAYKTPNLDRLAAEGRKFTDFYVAQAVCSASRAALLTGCYPNRVGIQGALGPKSTHGIHADETLISEICKQKNYATAIFGKWHLGHLPEFLPTRHGFDEYFGLPYSNDMWPFHPESPKAWAPLPLIEGDKAVIPEVTPREQEQLTTWYTERAVRFIEQNNSRPFFLYVPHAMVHVPLFVSDKFKGKSGAGLFGDVMMEVDWSVGQILDALKRAGVDDNTLLVFTSDNGPWLSYGDHAGSAKPLREGKGSAWDGGVRVSCLMRWPGKIPAGSICKQPAMTIDLLPTIAKLIGAKLPDRKIDGLDISALLTDDHAPSPHDALYFYWGQGLDALRSGKWSLHFPHEYRTLAGRPGGTGGIPAKYQSARTELALFDLEADIGQTTNLASQHPEVVGRLTALADRMRADLGDAHMKIKPTGARDPGRVAGPADAPVPPAKQKNNKTKK
jgi:arylsulfatase A-like enzyme